MRLGIVCLGVASLLVLSGCHAHSNPAQTKVTTPYGSIRYHCPPGQSKKGNCVPPPQIHTPHVK